MGEYDSFTVEDLYEITSSDKPDVLDDNAQGWADTAEMFKVEYETLEKNLEAVKAAWTAPAAAAFVRHILTAMQAVKAAQNSAGQRAEGLSSIAGRLRQANERVREQYDEWIKIKGSAADEFEDAKKAFAKSPFEYTMKHGGPPVSAESVQAQRRKPFDETARTYLNQAAEYHQGQQAKVLHPAPSYQPIEYTGPEPQDRDWDREDVSNINWSGGGPAAFAADSSGVAASQAAGPALQGGLSPGSSSVVPGGSGPVGPVGGPPGGGPPVVVPSGGPSVVGRAPSPPPAGRLPGRGITPRLSPTANRTPGLPANRQGMANGRNMANANGRNATNGRTAGNANGRNANGRNVNGRPAAGTNGRGPGGRGRGLVKSQMAPTDRTNRVRSSGEVLGRRAGTAKPGEAKPSKPVQRSIVNRGAGKGKSASTSPRADRTKQGYTKQVIGQRVNTAGWTRDPRVLKPVHDAGKVFAPRPKPLTPEQERQKRMDERRAKRDALQENTDGLSRAVIGNGVVSAAQLSQAEPTGSKPVKTEETFWQPAGTVTPRVIGTPRPAPAVEHDPGPGVFTSRPTPEDTEPDGGHTAGPTAFGTVRTPPSWQ